MENEINILTISIRFYTYINMLFIHMPFPDRILLVI